MCSILFSSAFACLEVGEVSRMPGKAKKPKKSGKGKGKK
jgi:hypothetical protein